MSTGVFLSTCYKKAEAVYLGVIVGQGWSNYHKIAQDKQKHYDLLVADFLNSPVGPDIAETIPSGTSIEIQDALKAMYQDVWGRPIDAEYLGYYTFLLSTGWTLADVRAEMEECYLQTVVMPVLVTVFLFQ